RHEQQCCAAKHRSSALARLCAGFGRSRGRYSTVWQHAGAMGRLDDLDLTKQLKRHAQDERLMLGGRRLAQLRLALGGKLNAGEPLGPPLVLVFEGWDASGKGGAINRLVAPLDARHVRVAAYAAPTPDEKRHHYLKRFWPALPGRGGMTIFDRSWYGRV